MVKVKLGAIVKEVPKGSLKWYKEAGWTVLEEKTVTKQEKVKNETNSKKNATK